MAQLQFQLLKKVAPTISGLPDQFAVHGTQASMTGYSRISARYFAAMVGLGLCGFFVLSVKPAMAAAVACTPQAPFTSCVAYTYSGGNQTFTVPLGITSIDVKVWGAGGSGGNTAYWTTQNGGGGGGFTRGTIAVIPIETLNLTVGQGGVANSTVTTFGGGAGGTGGTLRQTGGSGGGLSGIWRGTALTNGNQLVIAGGGGGISPGAPAGPTAPWGGPGGGSTGGQDTSPTLSGHGGTQTAGGVAASTNTGCDAAATAGAKFAGGKGANVSNFEGGGGGGGGWFGGGGGKCQSATNTSQNGDGGGGSGYIGGAGVTNASMTSGGASTGNINVAGTAGPAGGNTYPSYIAGVGVGGTTGSGGNGLIVIMYGAPATFTVTKTSSTVSDPIDTTDNPKAIPGSTVRYCIIVTNPNSVSATSVTVTDPVPSNLTFVSGSMRSGTGASCINATTVEDDDNSGPDESDPIGMSYSSSTVTGTTANLDPNSSFVMTFDATVN